MARLLSKLLKKAYTCFDRLSTNGKSAKISTLDPFALSLSKGERGVFQHPVSNRSFAGPRRAWRIGMAVLACLMASTSLAHAHGGMAGELGPPLVTSGLLGFVCYWLVMLWPSSNKKGNPEVGSGTQNKSAPRIHRRSPKNSAHVKRVPRWQKIERSGEVGSNVNSGRRATDG